VPCPVCAAPTSFCFRKKGWDVRACRRCGHRFADGVIDEEHVEREYGDAYFAAGGTGYADYLAEAPLLRAHGRYYGELLRPRGRHGTHLLDVGAAAGLVAAGFGDAGWEPTCIEPNARMTAYGRDRLGLEYAAKTVGDLPASATFDAVALVQVVGHVPDIAETFATLARVTANGGTLLVETWDAGSLVARAFGRRWHEYDPPKVLHYFTRTSLDALAGAHGFRRVARGRPPKHISVGHAASLLGYLCRGSRVGRAFARALALVPPDAVLPYPGDDIFYAIYERAEVAV